MYQIAIKFSNCLLLIPTLTSSALVWWSSSCWELSLLYLSKKKSCKAGL